MSKVPASKRVRWGRRILLVVAAIGVLAAVWAGAWYRGLWQPYKSWSGAERFVEVPRGASVTDIAGLMVQAGVVRDRLTFRVAARLAGVERQLKAGEYRFERAQSAMEVVARLSRGDVFLRRVVFPEGLTIAEMARAFEQQGLGEADAFVEAARNGSLVHDLDPRAEDLEGYLFPDTYALPRAASAADLVGQMVRGFRQVLRDLEAEGHGSRGGRSIREVVTLASLVEKETARADERPIVAGVYANRLRIGMALQCDPTVIYSLKRAGSFTGNLTRADLAFDSPYNTYRYAGLPPGPIASPGRLSLEAALAPAAVPFLYFVSRNDGSHVFATTLAEHAANVRRYQVEYFQRGRSRGR